MFNKNKFQEMVEYETKFKKWFNKKTKFKKWFNKKKRIPRMPGKIEKYEEQTSIYLFVHKTVKILDFPCLQINNFAQVTLES